MESGAGATRRARGEIERLPSGSLRVRVYAGIDPVTRKRQYLVETIAAGPDADEQAEQVRARLLREVPSAASSAIVTAPAPWPVAEVLSPHPLGSCRAARARQPRRKAGGLTVATIARLAGVSPPTVSKVLNGRPGVAPNTRRRVEELLRGAGLPPSREGHPGRLRRGGLLRRRWARSRSSSCGA